MFNSRRKSTGGTGLQQSQDLCHDLKRICMQGIMGQSIISTKLTFEQANKK